MSDEQDFKWSEEGAAVVKSVKAIAVYTNPQGEIVIRQEGDDYHFGGEDPFIVIPRDRVKDVISALEQELGD